MTTCEHEMKKINIHKRLWTQGISHEKTATNGNIPLDHPLWHIEKDDEVIGDKHFNVKDSMRHPCHHKLTEQVSRNDTMSCWVRWSAVVCCLSQYFLIMSKNFRSLRLFLFVAYHLKSSMIIKLVDKRGDDEKRKRSEHDMNFKFLLSN